MSINFERAKLLMDIVVSAGQHGPMYQKLASEAGKELKAMIDDTEKRDRVVTPPEGPENSAIEKADGSIERLAPAPLDNTTAGQKSEVTGEDLNARARRMADEAHLPGDDEAIERRKKLAEEAAERDKARQAELDLDRKRYQDQQEKAKHTSDPTDVRRKV